MLNCIFSECSQSKKPLDRNLFQKILLSHVQSSEGNFSKIKKCKYKKGFFEYCTWMRVRSFQNDLIMTIMCADFY